MRLTVQQAPGQRLPMPRFVASFTLALLLLAAVAFWPMYLSKRWAAIDLYTHAHAVLGTLWLLIICVQPLLILRGDKLTHRIMGRASLFVAFGFVISGLLLTHFRVSRMTEAVFMKEGIHIYLALALGLLFAVACALGVRWPGACAIHGVHSAPTTGSCARTSHVLLPAAVALRASLPGDHVHIHCYRDGVSGQVAPGAGTGANLVSKLLPGHGFDPRTLLRNSVHQRLARLRELVSCTSTNVKNLAVCQSRPNHSLKRSANGRPPGPVWRYAVHFRQPGPGVLPLSPA